jgi:hypothetical protein
VPRAGKRAVAQFTYDPPDTATGACDVATGGLVAVAVVVSSVSTAWVEESLERDESAVEVELEVVVAVTPE